MFTAAAVILGLLVLLKLVRRRRWARHARPRGRRWGRRARLRFVLRRLDTMPGQEREILDALDELFETAADARGELADLREEIAFALRADELDEASAEALLARLEPSIATLRAALARAMARVSGALARDQREHLAAMIEAGASPWRRGRAHG